MEIKIEFRSLDENADELFFAHHFAHVVLSRFGAEIAAVDLVIEQFQTPGDSALRRCFGTAKGPRFGHVRVEATGQTSKQAISDALQECATSVGLALFGRRDREPSP